MKKENAVSNQPRMSSITSDDLTWTDISFPSRKEIAFLEETYHFHHLALEDALSRTQLSKVDDYGTYLFLVLHFPGILPGEQTIRSAWMSAFIGNNYLITLHDEFPPLSELFSRFQADAEERRREFRNDTGYLLYRILNHLVDYWFPILDKLLARMENIEDRVFEETSNDTQPIAMLRRDIITLRRITWPSRPVVQDLKNHVRKFSRIEVDIYFDSIIDHLSRIWETLEESKEVIEVFKDSDFVLVTNRINRIVQTLTIMSSILLPFLIVSSIYGMNIHLPGGIERGSLASFGILIGIMFLLSGSMLYFFHRRHWI